MIDRPSRDRLATATRQYTSGLITNDALDDIPVDRRDRGAVAVKERAWCLYDDTYQHRAVGHHFLSKPDRDEIARWIMFLHSEREYSWPDYNFMRIVNSPLNVLTLGWWEIRERKRFDEFMAAGDFSVWPFISRREYEASRAQPKYFSGQYSKEHV